MAKLKLTFKNFLVFALAFFGNTITAQETQDDQEAKPKSGGEKAAVFTSSFRRSNVSTKTIVESSL